MSDSRKKSPFMSWTCARSDKPYKIDEHRRERRSVRTKLASGFDQDDRRLHSKDYGNPWNAPKDGKQYICDARYLRK